jgi:hypothetical protein
VLRFVRAGTLEDAEKKQLRKTVAPLLGPDVRFHVEAVSRIPASANGKLRPVLSLVERRATVRG